MKADSRVARQFRQDQVKRAQREYKDSPQKRRGSVSTAVGGPSVPGEPEKADILLDAPQLKAKTLAIEIEDLELANLLRVGKVRLQIENLDSELFLQTQLEDLLRTLNQLISTLNLSLGLFFAPVYNFNVAAAAWYDYLELARRWFEIPTTFSEGRKRPELPATRLPRSLPRAPYTAHRHAAKMLPPGFRRRRQ